MAFTQGYTNCYDARLLKLYLHLHLLQKKLIEMAMEQMSLRTIGAPDGN